MELHTEFLAHVDEHPEVHNCTDGWKTDQHMSFVAVFQNSACSGRLPGEAFIFIAEMYVKMTCLDKIF